MTYSNNTQILEKKQLNQNWDEYNLLNGSMPYCFANTFYFYFSLSTRGYQKVCRLMQWHQYFLKYAYRFCREYKTTNLLSVVTIQARYFIN